MGGVLRAQPLRVETFTGLRIRQFEGLSRVVRERGGNGPGGGRPWCLPPADRALTARLAQLADSWCGSACPPDVTDLDRSGVRHVVPARRLNPRRPRAAECSGGGVAGSVKRCSRCRGRPRRPRRGIPPNPAGPRLRPGSGRPAATFRPVPDGRVRPGLRRRRSPRSAVGGSPVSPGCHRRPRPPCRQGQTPGRSGRRHPPGQDVRHVPPLMPGPEVTPPSRAASPGTGPPLATRSRPGPGFVRRRTSAPTTTRLQGQ